MKNQYDFNYIKANLDEINNNIKSVCEKINKDPKEITIVGVTKTVESEKVNFSLQCGITTIGENKVQEFLSKKDEYINNKKIHFIGHLQTNKVKYICSLVDVIESVDSINLIKEIDKQCKKINKKITIFIEVNIGDEESKSGVNFNETINIIKQAQSFENIVIKGLMAIPPVCVDEKTQKEYFAKMKTLFDNINKNRYNKSVLEFLSMGMSNDYMIAIEEGANVIRLGTCLYGKRNYNV